MKQWLYEIRADLKDTFDQPIIIGLSLLIGLLVFAFVFAVTGILR